MPVHHFGSLMDDLHMPHMHQHHHMSPHPDAKEFALSDNAQQVVAVVCILALLVTLFMLFIVAKKDSLEMRRKKGW